jgi:hypothetical protein
LRKNDEPLLESNEILSYGLRLAEINYGYAPLGTEPTAGDARFNTQLKYRFGFGPA